MAHQLLRIKRITDRSDMDEIMEYVWQVDAKAPMEDYYKSGHSPIYTQRFHLFCYTELSVMSQLRTHEKNGCQFFCDSARPDTGNAPDATPRDSMRHYVIDCNAQHLMDIAAKRLCMKTEEPTRKFVNHIRLAMRGVDPALSDRMIVKCELLREGCNEFKPCGKYYPGS